MSAFQVPKGVREHRVPNTPRATDMAPITWRGMTASWSRAEQESVRGLPASELALIHELKARMDAVLT